MEYVYKLNLKSAEEIVKSVVELEHLDNDKYDRSSPFGFITYPDPNQILKPEYRHYLNFYWNQATLNYKGPKNQGSLHKDNWRDPRQLIWAVNWVWGDDSIIEYWENDLIKESKITPDGGGSYRIQAYTDREPTKIYSMPTGVYLLNASVYHRATNIGNNTRFALSLRCIPNMFNSWEAIVNHFEKYFE